MTSSATGSDVSRLLLVRHGAVDFDSTDFVETPRGRQWDPPLGERGREQARLLAARLVAAPPPVAIYVSPFRRCLQTVEPYTSEVGIEPEVLDDLGEVFIGDWEGRRFEEIVATNRDLVAMFREADPGFGIAPGGETGAELRARVVAAVEDALARTPRGRILLVAHGGVINAYLGHVMGVPHDLFFLPDNGSISTVEIRGDRRDMRFLNDVRHLSDPRLYERVADENDGAAAPAD